MLSARVQYERCLKRLIGSEVISILRGLEIGPFFIYVIRSMLCYNKIMKTCSICNIEKPMEEFFKSGTQKSGSPKFRGDCKDCAKKTTGEWRAKNRSHYNNYVAMWRAKNPIRQHATEIKRRYDLPIEEYNRILVEQLCKCKICGKEHDPTRSRGRLYVDHCHDSKKVRGLLCGGCNSALGYFEDNIETLLKAIEYLKSE